MLALSEKNFTLISNNISTHLNIYFGILIFIFGSVGNVLNILVLSQRFLRTNSCALLFLFSSLANLLAICTGLIPRILSSGSMDLTSTIGWICKCHTFILYVSRSVAIWLTMLATIDRWLLSNGNISYGQINSIKNVQKQMIIVILLSILLYSQTFYCYEANLLTAPQNCYGKNKTCQLIGDLFFILILILFPLLLMIVFSLMTIANLHQAQCRLYPICVTPENTKTQNRWKQTDHYLRTVLFVQILLLLLLNIPLVILKLYSTFIFTRTALIDLLYTFTFLLNFLTNGMSFYIYTLFGGSMFRKALIRLVNKGFL
jgi:hypothetical protein